MMVLRLLLFFFLFNAGLVDSSHCILWCDYSRCTPAEIHTFCEHILETNGILFMGESL